MKKLSLMCLLGLAGSILLASTAAAQVAPASYPFYTPQGPQSGTFGFPLYFGYPGTNGTMMTYNFRSGGTGSFNYGTVLPNGVSYTRGVGGNGSGSFAPGASTFYGN